MEGWPDPILQDPSGYRRGSKKQLQIDRKYSLGSGAETYWAFSGQNPKNVLALMSLRQLNGLQWHLKNYLWPKRLYQVITNLFFLANTPTPGQVLHHVEKNLTPSCLRSLSTGITGRYLPLPCYNRTEVHSDKASKNKSAVQCTFSKQQ